MRDEAVEARGQKRTSQEEDRMEDEVPATPPPTRPRVESPSREDQTDSGMYSPDSPAPMPGPVEQGDRPDIALDVVNRHKASEQRRNRGRHVEHGQVGESHDDVRKAAASSNPFETVEGPKKGSASFFWPLGRVLPESTGTGRPGADEDSPAAAMKWKNPREAAISKLTRHPGPKMKAEEVTREERMWKPIGSGRVARTFLNAVQLITTTRSGPAMVDIKSRTIRDMSTGKVIDKCIPDDTPDNILHRRLPTPMHIRVELEMKDANQMFKVKGADVVEVFSQPRAAAEAGLRRFNGQVLRPGWSLDITMDDPEDGKPWDLSRKDKRRKLIEMVKHGKPYLLIGSRPCTAFSALQGLSEGKRRDPKAFEAEKK